MTADSGLSGELPQEALDAAAALVEALRGQIMDRVRGQEQLVLVTITLAGVAASFGTQLKHHPELAAIFGLGFMVFALVVLRYDEEIAVIASYLLDEAAFGAHARAQAGWEKHKFERMQAGGWIRHPGTVAQVIAIYGAPIVASAVFSAAAIVLSPGDFWTWAIVPITLVLCGLFVLGANEIIRGYQDLGLGPRTPPLQGSKG